MISVEIVNRPEGGPWRGSFSTEESAANFERRAAKRGLVTQRIATPAEHIQHILKHARKEG